jgi:hypothetical protein
MKKLFNIRFNLIIFLLLCLFLAAASQNAYAVRTSRLLVSPVDIPTAQSSYGVYPNTVNLIANDIINSLNQNYDVPDLNFSKELIKSYRLEKDYKNFMMQYRDNRILDYEICNKIHDRLGIDKILLVSGGYDTQNMFLRRSDSYRATEVSSMVFPFMRIFSKDMIFAGFPFFVSSLHSNFNDKDLIAPSYNLKINVAMVDATSGRLMWEKNYNSIIESSKFGNPVNSFGENYAGSEKIRDFSKKIVKKLSEDESFLDAMAEPTADYSSIQGFIVPTKYPYKAVPKDGKMTRDGQSFSGTNNDKYLENSRKQNYKNWVKQRATTK